MLKEEERLEERCPGVVGAETGAWGLPLAVSFVASEKGVTDTRWLRMVEMDENEDRDAGAGMLTSGTALASFASLLVLLSDIREDNYPHWPYSFRYIGGGAYFASWSNRGTRRTPAWA
jgi:hypothetical protein